MPNRPLSRTAALLGWLFAACAACADPSAAVCAPNVSSGPSFVQAAARVAPAVGTVIVVRPNRSDDEDADGPAYFPLSGRARRTAVPAGERFFASAFALEPGGYLVTSAHALRDALETWVVLPDGRRVSATVAGLDRRSDVALLKVDGDPLRAAEPLRNPPCAGQWVAALGAPFGFEASLSVGVVSAFPRLLRGSEATPLIQTDVAINPGSSGGPLFDPAGRVIGMNTMIYTDHGGYAGLSFAVPVETVLAVAAALRSAGAVRRSDIGAMLQVVDPPLAEAFGLARGGGALIASVRPLSPAQEAGLRAGDILLAIDGHRVSSAGDAQILVGGLRAHEAVVLEVWRDRRLHHASVRPVYAEPDLLPPAARPALRREMRLGLTLARGGPNSAPGLYVVDAAGSSLLAGLGWGDRIGAVNGVPVNDADAFDAQLARAAPAPVIALLVWRGGAAMYVAVRRLPE